MQVVIPAALPPAAVAGELARQLPQRAPRLHAWLRQAAAAVERLDLREAGCTPFEAWQLRQAGFSPAPGQPLGAGLGPLRAGAQAGAGEPVWLAELAHVALSTDRVVLADPDGLAVSAQEDAALHEAVRPLLEGSGFDLRPLRPGLWLARLPEGVRAASASPAVVAGGSLDAWWPQDAQSRPWRRLLNEIQMAWHEHPANEARAGRGLPPVNGLWLYGGARPWTPGPAEPAEVHEDLLAPAHGGDWHAWLQALAALDARLPDPLRPAAPPPTLVLTGAARTARLTLPANRLLRRLAWPKKNWNTWWSSPD